MSKEPAENVPESTDTPPLLLIGAGIAVFIICSIVQGAGGSSMFSTTYEDPDSFVLGLLISVTFYPGWLATLFLVGSGIIGLVLDHDS